MRRRSWGKAEPAAPRACKRLLDIHGDQRLILKDKDRKAGQRSALGRLGLLDVDRPIIGGHVSRGDLEPGLHAVRRVVDHR